METKIQEIIEERGQFCSAGSKYLELSKIQEEALKECNRSAVAIAVHSIDASILGKVVAKIPTTKEEILVAIKEAKASAPYIALNK